MHLQGILAFSHERLKRSQFLLITHFLHCCLTFCRWGKQGLPLLSSNIQRMGFISHRKHPAERDSSNTPREQPCCLQDGRCLLPQSPGSPAASACFSKSSHFRAPQAAYLGWEVLLKSANTVLSLPDVVLGELLGTL